MVPTKEKTIVALDFDRIIPLHEVSRLDQYGLEYAQR